MGCRRWFIRSNQKPLHTHTHTIFLFLQISGRLLKEVTQKFLQNICPSYELWEICVKILNPRTPNQITIAYNRKKVNHIGHSRRQHSSWKRTVRSRLDSPSTLERKLRYNFWQGFQHVNLTWNGITITWTTWVIDAKVQESIQSQ